jgi:prepilin-type processing-associated H-X9-DG protein
LADYPSVPFRGDRHSGGINILFADYHVKKYMFLKARPSINSGDPSADWYNWSWHETAGTYPQWPDIP